MDSNNTNITSSGSVATPNPIGAASSQNVEVQTIPPMQHHKGKSMVWMVLLLLFAFISGLALAAWYFQTQIQKF